MILFNARPRLSINVKSRSEQRPESEAEVARVAVVVRFRDEGEEGVNVKLDVVDLIFSIMRSNGSSMLLFGKELDVSQLEVWEMRCPSTEVMAVDSDVQSVKLGLYVVQRRQGGVEISKRLLELGTDGDVF